MPHSVVGSVRSQFNIGEAHEDDLLKARLWEYLGLTRIYTKRKGMAVGHGMTARKVLTTPHTIFHSIKLIFLFYSLPAGSGGTSGSVGNPKGDHRQVLVCQYLKRIAARIQLCLGVGDERQTFASEVRFDSQIG